MQDDNRHGLTSTDQGNNMTMKMEALVRADAFIDKLVGDKVTALFIPGYAGKDHAHKAAQIENHKPEIAILQ